MVLSLCLLTVTILGASATDESCSLLSGMVDIGEMDTECCYSAATVVAFGVSTTMPSAMSMIPDCFAERLGQKCEEDGKTPTEAARWLAGANMCCNSYGGSTCEALILKGADEGPGGMNDQVIGQMDADTDGKIDICQDGSYKCPPPTCDTYECPATHSLVSNAATTFGNHTALCCFEPSEPMCNDFTGCGTNKTLRTNSANIKGDNTSTCCADACSGFTDCPATHSLVSSAATTPGNDQATCCTAARAMCSGFTDCPATKNLVPAAANTPGNTEATCCVEKVVDGGRACNTIGMMAATSVLLAMAVSSA